MLRADGKLFAEGILDERLIARLEPLNRRHWEESGDEKLVLNADWKTYLQMQEAGHLRLFLLNNFPEGGSIQVVGYAAFYVHESAHYGGVKQAIADSVFVDRPYRDWARAFMRWCEGQLLEKDAVEAIMVQAPVSHPSAGKFFEAIGYSPVEVTYRKHLNVINEEEVPD